jgi:ABC-type uncharacterized transport system fused permease/ATPase subunit
MFHVSFIILQAIATQLGIIRTQRTLEMFTTSYDYLVYVIPYLVVAPLYFQGKLNLGSITQASEAFYYVRSDFSIIVNYFEKISAFSAGIDRLSTFIHRINAGGWQSAGTAEHTEKDSGKEKPQGSLADLTRSLARSPGGYLRVSGSDETDLERSEVPSRSTISLVIVPFIQPTPGQISRDKDESVKRSVLQCENLSICTPDGSRILIGGVLQTCSGIASAIGDIPLLGINFTVSEGDRVLVTGPSGTGKSSLLRAISGLWELGSGKVIWNCSLHSSQCAVGDSRDAKSEAPEGVFFLPQKPYNLLGSLRQQIAYPDIFPGDEQESSARHLARQRNGKARRQAVPVHEAQSLDGDSDLLEILRKVKLDTLASRMGGGDTQEGLGVFKDWTKVIPPYCDLNDVAMLTNIYCRCVLFGLV